jgi:hypothetical protein
MSGGYDGQITNSPTEWNIYRGLVGNPEGKRPLGRLGHRPEDNIKMGFRKNIIEKRMDSSGSGQRAVTGSCGDKKEPLVSTKCFEFLE